jgi:glutamate-1-semialdehyde 2,1-aminomutase
VAVCGYHGWQDWYIGSTARHLGVPQSTRALTHPFAYDDGAALARLLGEQPIAAVVMEPMSVKQPAPGFLAAVRDLTHDHGALLVFDETVTGFRFAAGGAQQLFGVTPDLATFGKGLANGFPLAAVTGRAEVMERMADVFFSTTFGGETLSLAAARAVLDKLEREPVLETLARRGAELADGTRARLESAGLLDAVRVTGHPTWSFVVFGDTPRYDAAHLKTFYLQECLARGVLTLGTHNVCYALTDADVEHVLAAYAEIFTELRAALDAGDLEQRLRCTPLVPLFQVRPGR